MYAFLSRIGTFPSLGRFSNIQNYLLSLSFQDVKYSSTQYIVPWSNVWRIPALCLTSISGWFFISTKIFQAREWFWALPHTHTRNHSLAWKILVSIKNHPLTLVHNRGQVYAIPCFTGKYTGWKCTIIAYNFNYDITLSLTWAEQNRFLDFKFCKSPEPTIYLRSHFFVQIPLFI